MNLTINGETYLNLDKGMSVSELLDYLSLPKAKIAVERNKEIVSKSSYATTILQNEDILEIITFIGGG